MRNMVLVEPFGRRADDVADDVPVSRREFDKLDTRVDSMDRLGTRGVQIVQERVSDLSKEVARLEGQMEARWNAHEQMHENERKERVSSRRWAIGATATMLAAMAALITLVIYLIQLVHG